MSEPLHDSKPPPEGLGVGASQIKISGDAPAEPPAPLLPMGPPPAPANPADSTGKAVASREACPPQLTANGATRASDRRIGKLSLAILRPRAKFVPVLQTSNQPQISRPNARVDPRNPALPGTSWRRSCVLDARLRGFSSRETLHERDRERRHLRHRRVSGFCSSPKRVTGTRRTAAQGLSSHRRRALARAAESIASSAPNRSAVAA